MSTAKPRPTATRGGLAPAPSPSPSPAQPAVVLRKPVFTTIDKLLPQTHGHNLTARVLSARTVLDKPAARTRVAECLVGDPTATVLFTARNGQIEMLKPGNTVIFRNARIDMFKDTMRLAVDKWGLIEVVEEPADFKVNEDNNMSEIEYELVSVPPKKQERKK
ncbi:hypothetical protein CFC21_094977 [Triticum aestivum]|uniref:Single-stranded DNA binding protein Ssb-like OB fold domain-containing protein n=3 Tax=Triticum TaxID=4564 RepID=A0A9R1MWY5_WHEAT|nr:uncharacterized protein At4g28440-like [Triticum aestivum]XP_048540373.1 uncharacterized protein At4g28440-like [Triticum urartu]KAF7092501.1 hypothetical protein CFC21_094977 [Triticum aestivum]